MPIITIQEAQATLSDLIHRLTTGEELLITEKDRPIAKLTLTPHDVIFDSYGAHRIWN